MLVALRRAVTNVRHPGVVSLPTMRVPAATKVLLPTPAHEPDVQDEVEFRGVLREQEQFGVPGAGAVAASYLTEAILSRKLGAADLLETGQLTGWCAVRMTAEGIVDDPTGTTDSELTLMYTILVRIDTGANLLPTESAAYSHIRWVDPKLFLLAWHRRDAQLLFPDANPFEICIRGLCIRSGVQLLKMIDGLVDVHQDGTGGEVEPR